MCRAGRRSVPVGWFALEIYRTDAAVGSPLGPPGGRGPPAGTAIRQLAGIRSRVDHRANWRTHHVPPPSRTGDVITCGSRARVRSQLANVSRDAWRRRLGLAGPGLGRSAGPPRPRPRWFTLVRRVPRPFRSPADPPAPRPPRPSSPRPANWLSRLPTPLAPLPHLAPPPATVPRGPAGARAVPRTARESAARAGAPRHRRHQATAAPPRGPLHWPPAVTPARSMSADPWYPSAAAAVSPAGTGPVRLYTYYPTQTGAPAVVHSFRCEKIAGRGRVYYGGAPCATFLPVQSGPLF